MKWCHFLQRFLGIRCTTTARDWGLGPKRAALAGPPAAMVQPIPRNLRTIFSDLDLTSKLKKMMSFGE